MENVQMCGKETQVARVRQGSEVVSESGGGAGSERVREQVSGQLPPQN